ncbi:hypothetical protein SB00610_05430 [Klebsiella quasipneumoniae subsp. similipneumoniae]|nr:hypothetical protein SB00610_05430 [Klebsiella quasipneumoniae subsp. similipneumoniae]
MPHQSVYVEERKDPHIKAQVFGFALLAGVPGIDGEHIAGNGMVAELKPGKGNTVDHDILSDIHIAQVDAVR